ncbi:hypothetical protein LCGC14_1712010, partial [marine sediment metagenome]
LNFIIYSINIHQKFLLISQIIKKIKFKYPTNSRLLYGEDIRNQMPDTVTINFDYGDILNSTKISYQNQKSQ